MVFQTSQPRLQKSAIRVPSYERVYSIASGCSIAKGPDDAPLLDTTACPRRSTPAQRTLQLVRGWMTARDLVLACKGALIARAQQPLGTHNLTSRVQYICLSAADACGNHIMQLIRRFAIYY